MAPPPVQVFTLLSAMRCCCVFCRRSCSLYRDAIPRMRSHALEAVLSPPARRSAPLRPARCPASRTSEMKRDHRLWALRLLPSGAGRPGIHKTSAMEPETLHGRGCIVLQISDFEGPPTVQSARGKSPSAPLFLLPAPTAAFPTASHSAFRRHAPPQSPANCPAASTFLCLIP